MAQCRKSCAVTMASAPVLAACIRAAMEKSPGTFLLWYASLLSFVKDAAHPHKALTVMLYGLIDVACAIDKINLSIQGADNFRKEFKQLRRSFRFNEYKEIREQNPPTNPVARVSVAPCVP